MNECGHYVAEHMTSSISISWMTVGEVFVMRVRQVDLAESVPLHIKPQPMLSNLKVRLDLGHVVVDAIG